MREDPSSISRRAFLASTAAAAAATGVRRTWAQSPANKTVGFALVGVGNLTMGQLLPAFAKCKIATSRVAYATGFRCAIAVMLKVQSRQRWHEFLYVGGDPHNTVGEGTATGYSNECQNCNRKCYFGQKFHLTTLPFALISRILRHSLDGTFTSSLRRKT